MAFKVMRADYKCYFERSENQDSAEGCNEPMAERIAEIKNISIEQVAERTTKNARGLFKI